AMPPYCYSPLKSELGSIRLLRIMPHEDETADIQCELFEYPLHISRSTHPYEALSYVWGDPDKTYPILVQGTRFNVTVNLYAALLQLRNHSIERVLWVDAICIDQGNQAEKERQIQNMANIYGQANRVLVWLGEASNDSDLAFNEMRRVKGKEDMTTLEIQRLELAGLALLQRPWFQRIWILQEIAAAQNVLIMCGHKKIEGYAFCTGIESLNISYRTRQDLQRMICSVTYLIREAAYIPDHSTQILGSMSLSICPLSVLLDMHHAQKATKRHDKVYALLSMSSDDLRGTSLSPNYTISWEDLFRRLLKHLIPGATSVQTCKNREVAIIESKGRIIGKVVSVQKDSTRGDRLCLETAHEETPWHFEGAEDWSNHWSIQMSAKTIQNGDFICVLEGASKPTIVRLHRDYFTVVVLEVLFPDETPAWSRAVKEKISSLSKLYPSRDLLLVWDWENSL
ncbi:heterokaryon incompatibility protein-domain-containing protein, partial [Paraphoma chrysanthemicola]